MSCIIDYDSSTLERKKNGLGKLQSRAGLSITGGQQGAHGGKCQNKSSNKTLGQCFVCLEAATLQVRASDTTLSCYNFTSWTPGLRTWEITAFFPLTFLIVSVHLVWRGRGLQRGSSQHPSSKYQVFALQSVQHWQQGTRAGGHEVHTSQGDHLDRESSVVWSESDDIPSVSNMSGTRQTSDVTMFHMFTASVQSCLSTKPCTQARMQTFVREQS